jgi:hypothetical protein
MQTKNTEMINDIVENYWKFPASYFAEKYSKKIQRIRFYASKNGVSSNKRWEIEKDDIIKRYLEKEPIKSIARHYGHNYKTLERKLIQWGIKVRTQSEGNQIYYFDKSFFKTIDTPEKAYWLGFIYADGNVYLNKKNSKSAFQISLANIDREHLEKLKTAIKSEHPIYKDKNCVKFIINNIELCDDLMSLGVLPKKSLTTVFPSCDQVPQHFLSYFIRGYFDGDGQASIYPLKNQWKIGFLGTINFVNFIQNFFAELGATSPSIYPEKRSGDGKIFYLNYSGAIKYKKETWNKNNNFEIIYKAIFEKAPVFLERKQTIIERIKNDR